ncbi:hypothetical protein BDN72DRAFT_894047, partial [Pluteus cervinus]
MTPAARADQLRRQRDARQEYSKNLNSGWTQLENIAQDISNKNHKSVQRVQRDLHLLGRVMKRPRANPWNAYCREMKERHRGSGDIERGRSFLPSLVQRERENYKKLPAEEKQKLAESLSQQRNVELTTRCIFGRSKANDISSTMHHARDMFLNLKSRTGVEILVYTVPGTTDLPVKGTAWSTDGVQDFMEGTMKIDEQDLLGKMEGHALHGVKGAAENYVQRKNIIRNEIRLHILNGLRTITQNPTARMEFVHYWEK